jgi:hypothetical protein
MTITVPLTEPQEVALRELAAELRLGVEEVARLALLDLLDRGDTDFEEAADYVLKKNAELYRRLS